MKKRVLALILTTVMVLALVPAMASANEWQLGDIVHHEKSFTIEVGVRYTSPIRMIYVEGGTFTLGWEEGTPSTPAVGTNPGGIPADTKALPGVVVSDFWIADTVVSNHLWNAVMGANPPTAATQWNIVTGRDYYEVHEFYARLEKLTGMVFYMPTEAQWEYAAKGGQPGFELGHNKLPFPSSATWQPVGGALGGGAVRRALPNILGIYDFLTIAHGEWAWNDWHNVHQGGTDPTGYRGPIHGQKTRRGGSSSTGQRELHSRLIRSIDGTGPSFRMVVSADMVSVPPGMTFPRDIMAPKTNDLTVPNSHRDMRWVTPEGFVWEGQFRGYAGGAMKVWETGEAVLRPHNFNGMDAGDIVGQWYTFNNYGLVIVPNADSPNANKSRILIPYMFIGEEEGHRSVSTINDRWNAMTAAPDVLFPNMLMFPTGRLQLTPEADTIEFYANNELYSPDTAIDWGLTYEDHLWFGGSYAAIQKPVVPNLVATADLKAGEGIVAADHYLVEFNGIGRAMDTVPVEHRGRDMRVYDGPEKGWWMGYGFGGIHTYRFDFDLPTPEGVTPALPGNARSSVYTVLEGNPGSPAPGGLARGPWYTVNNMFMRIQNNAAGTAWHDMVYVLVADHEGKIDSTVARNFTLRNMTFQDYERGDNRRYHLRWNVDVDRHAFEQGGTTGFGGMGNTTWRTPPAAHRACPGIPTGPELTDWWSCGLSRVACECPTQYRAIIALNGDTKVTAGAATTASYTVSTAGLANVDAIQFAIEVDGTALKTISFAALNGFALITSNSDAWVEVEENIWRRDFVLSRNGSVFGGVDIFNIVFDVLAAEGSTTVKLLDVKVAATAAGVPNWVDFDVSNAAVTTVIDKWFSDFDVNKDGVIDLLDISMASYFYMAKLGDANWNQAKAADVNNDGVVDIEDLILIRANFSK